MNRRLLALVLTITALGSIGVMRALSSPGDGKPGPSPVAENATVPGPDDEVKTEYTVSAVTAPRAGTSCPAGWSYFDNPVLHYGICYPAGWGFSDFTAPAPMTQIPSRQLENLHLLSPKAFPWNVGDASFDAITARGMTDIELDILQAGATVETGCDPSTTLQVANLTLRSCEEALNALGEPVTSGSGVIRSLTIVLPLAQAPSSDTSAAGSRLQIVVRAAFEDFGKEAELVWQIAKTVRPY